MKKLFVDTNIIIDLLAKREKFHLDAAKIFSLADRGKVEVHISTLSIANTNYILTKINDAEQARKTLQKLEVLVIMVDLTDKIVRLSLNDEDFKDFEDGLQYYSALESDSDIIITRNIKDFKASKVPVMTPKGFLSSQKF